MALPPNKIKANNQKQNKLEYRGGLPGCMGDINSDEENISFSGLQTLFASPTRSAVQPRVIASAQGNMAENTAQSTAAERATSIMARLKRGISGSGINSEHSAPRITTKDLNMEDFDFSAVSATTQGVATAATLREFFEKLQEVSGTTGQNARKALNSAFVVYITLNGCSDRQDFSGGEMSFTADGKQYAIPASIIPTALGAGMGLRKIGNALADLQRRLLEADPGILANVLRQTADWAPRPKYPTLILETAVFCSGLSADEKKFAAVAKARRLKNSEDPYFYAGQSANDDYFNVNNVDMRKNVKRV